MRRMFLCVSVVFALVIGCCCAAVPPRMNYQGKLTDADGKLVADGAYEMIFSLYNAPTDGDLRWTETWGAGTTSVQVTNGLFNVLLGTHTPIIIVFDENYWLEMQVNSGAIFETILPRQQIASAAYAFRAEKANRAVSADEADSALVAESVIDGAITLDKLDTSTIRLDGDGYGILRVPAVSGISPDTRTEGYSPFTATITGENFQSVSQAKIGSVDLTSESVSSSTSMTAVVPTGIPAGAYDVSVSNINLDWGTRSGLFTVNTPTPTTTPTVTPTPTATRTPTPTPTPTPWCASKGGYWFETGLGSKGCWIQGTGTNSCTNVCSAPGIGLQCMQGNWDDDTSCSVGLYFRPAPPHDCQGAYGASFVPIVSSGHGNYRGPSASQDCDAPSIDSDWQRLCVCIQ